MIRALAVALAIGTAAEPAGAQTLRTRLIDSSGAAVAGALVTLRAPDGRAERVTLSDSLGGAVAATREAGVVRVDMRRIGYAPWTSPPVVLTADSDSLLLTVPATPRAPLQAGEAPLCGQPPAGSAAAALLSEAWLALRIAHEAVATGSLTLSVEHTVTRMGRGSRGRGRPDSTRTTIGAAWPFPVTPPDQLRREGWAREERDGSWTWAVPDTTVLFGEWFAEGHCWTVALETTRAGAAAALEFTPRGEAGHLSGRFLFDRQTWLLRALEWRYTRLPAELPRGEASGSVTFARAPGGLVAVDTWHLVVPTLARRYTGELVPLGTLTRAGRVLQIVGGP